MFLERLEKRVKAIEARNARVELDKQWEKSIFRRALVAAFTYLSVGAYFQAIGIRDAWLHAIVPTLAFLLSTLTLPFFKELWTKNFSAKKVIQ